jgi:hypothetical protein
MSGLVLGVLGKRAFDFSTLAVGASQAYFVEERIDVSQYTECTVLLHVHDATMTGGTITFDVYGEGHSAEDPSLSFRTASSLFASVAISSSGTGLLKFGGPTRGEYVALRVQGSRASALPVKATVSVELVLKTPSDSE